MVVGFSMRKSKPRSFEKSAKYFESCFEKEPPSRRCLPKCSGANYALLGPDFLSCVASIVDNDDALEWFVRTACQGRVAATLREEWQREGAPSVREAAHFIQRHQLSEQVWEEIRRFCRLPADYSRTRLEKEIQQMQHEGWGSPTLTPQNHEPVPFKISFDNASITSNRKVKAETGVIEDLRDASKKHEKGCHFVIYLVCDLVALCQLLGLTAVYHPKAFWKCAWCLVTKDSIADFTHESWPLRDFLLSSSTLRGNHCFDFHFISCHLACFMYSWLSHAK